MFGESCAPEQGWKICQSGMGLTTLFMEVNVPWMCAAMEKPRANRDYDDGPIVKSRGAAFGREHLSALSPLQERDPSGAGEGPKSASMMLVGEQPGDQAGIAPAIPSWGQPGACSTKRWQMPALRGSRCL